MDEPDTHSPYSEEDARVTAGMHTRLRPGEPPWWEDHDNLVLLTAYLADTGHDAAEVAYAVEKPWKFEDEFDVARRL